MADREFHIKVGDTAPALEAICKDADGDAVSVAGATVRFHMRLLGGASTKVNALATIVDGPAGQVKYQWQTADTDTAGNYRGEFQVTFSNGTIETFPNRGDLPLEITIWDQIA